MILPDEKAATCAAFFARVEVEDLSVRHRPDEILESGVEIEPGDDPDVC